MINFLSYKAKNSTLLKKERHKKSVIYLQFKDNCILTHIHTNEKKKSNHWFIYVVLKLRD